TYPGYHTIYLDSSIPLTNGDDFAVVIKFTTPGYGSPVAVEKPRAGYSDAATANPGESYISSNGTSWTDCTTLFPNTNVCIKAIAGVTVPDFSFSTSSKKWKMFSVPVELNDSSPPSVLEDDLGGQDDTVWKVYRWETEANDYSKYPDIPDINPGIAFWIITKDSKDIDVGEGKSTDASSDYTIPLSYSVSLNQGWNQIGNPFAFNINRDDVKVEKDGVTKSISAASDWVRNRIWWYSDSSSDYDHTKTVLESWEGYWIKALTEDCKLLIPPISADGSLQALAKSEENYLQIIAKVEDLKDRYNFIGLSNKAKDSYDTEDVEEAPPISSYISLSFSHSDWGKDSGSYTQDIRKVPDKKKSSPEKITWDMQIDTDQLNKTITLEWRNTEGIPEEYYLYLTDRNENVLTDMREKDTYSFTTSTGKDTFKIVATTKELSLSPEDLTLTEVYNYPNPANDTTNIHFKLGAEASVTIRMYTISGELVKTLVGNEAYAVGTYSEPWQLNNNEGEKVARGIYILLVKATNPAKTLIKTNKIAVIK
ncbi:T9SS type A sorting domain-containing protein, partial [Patescibacteria group bacterium]|nr:T9SS type A sorting domain-containing protein [Patescibacteria group bacterium]